MGYFFNYNTNVSILKTYVYVHIGIHSYKSTKNSKTQWTNKHRS